MNQQIDKNKVREKIQSTNSKDILYLIVNPIQNNSLKSAIKEIERFLSNGNGEILLLRK
jgi:hypothetical protein